VAAPTDSLPNAFSLAIAEGTAAAWQLSLRADPQQAPWFSERALESASFGLRLQHNELSVYPFPRGELVLGGTRFSGVEAKVRIDYTHHTLALLWACMAAEAQGQGLEFPATSPGQ
jgi:hypothetical protein